MKKFRLLAALISSMIVGSAMALQYMVVTLTDGKTVIYNVEDVQSVTFRTDDEPVIPEVDWVDLGLPSGLQWASCNLGSDALEGAGNYYQWGDVLPYQYGSSENKNYQGVSESTLLSEGVINDRGQLTPAHDPVTVAYGEGYRMPTTADLAELKDNCDWKWEEINGLKCVRFTSKVNAKSIVIPAVGIINGDNCSLEMYNELATFWTSTVSGSYCYDFYMTIPEKDNYGYNGGNFINLTSYRKHAHPVRGVRQKDEPSIPDNPIVNVEEFNSCYRYLNGWMGRDFYEGVVYQGDEIMGCCFGQGNYFDDGRYLNACIHSLHLDDWRSKAGMEAALNGIIFTNSRIRDYGGEGYPDKLDPVVAPLRAIRAYYHFWLMELYGDVPIIDRNVDIDQAIERMPRKQVAEFIEKELLEILQEDGGLSKANDASTYGKPNYWMAAALLAKVYLNWGVYTNDITTVNNDTPNPKLDDCVYWCDKIIQSGLFEVGQGYRQKFYPDNGVHIKDFIYALDVDPETKVDGTATWHRWFGFKKESMCRPLPFTINFNSYTSLAGQTVLTMEAVNRFCLEGDERNIMILKGPQTRFDANYQPTDEPVIIYKDVDNPSKSNIQLNYTADFDFDDASIYSLGDEATPSLTPANVKNGTALANIQKGARLYKYPAREIDYELYNRQQANDAPIFRLADILLMKAECIMRGASATMGHTPMELFNQIRLCSSAPTIDHNPSWDELLDERSREFILEPWRRNDLIRCGRFEDDWGQKNQYKKWTNDDHSDFEWVEREGVKDPNRRLMPIHRDMLITYPNWSQNPGYQGL